MSFGKTEGLHLKDARLLSLTWVFSGTLNSFYERRNFFIYKLNKLPVQLALDLTFQSGFSAPASSCILLSKKSLWFPSSQLSSRCHGFDKAIVTQANTAVGSKLVYDGEKRRTLQVTPEIFSTFAKVWGFVSSWMLPRSLLLLLLFCNRCYFTALLKHLEPEKIFEFS